MASSSADAGVLAKTNAGAVRSGTSSTARSRCGSYSTTVPVTTSPPTSTPALFDPATTCALVSTLSGPMTNPVPSIRREQDSEIALTLTIEACAAATAGLPATAGSGGSTLVTGVGASGSRIAGNPESLNTSRSWVEMSLAWLGITSSTPASTVDERIADESQV